MTKKNEFKCLKGHLFSEFGRYISGDCRKCAIDRASSRHKRIRKDLILKRKEISEKRKQLEIQNRPIIIMEKFMKKVEFEPNTGCWLWTGSVDKDGYARFGNKERSSSRASRFIFEAIKHHPGDMYVLHKCDTPACVNPDHMFLGTAKDNALDCIKKNRHSSKKRKK